MAFYNGLAPVLAALATSNFVYFYAYNALKQRVLAAQHRKALSAGFV